jgi:hypothetical protein
VFNESNKYMKRRNPQLSSKSTSAYLMANSFNFDVSAVLLEIQEARALRELKERYMRLDYKKIRRLAKEPYNEYKPVEPLKMRARKEVYMMMKDRRSHQKKVRKLHNVAAPREKSSQASQQTSLLGSDAEDASYSYGNHFSHLKGGAESSNSDYEPQEYTYLPQLEQPIDEFAQDIVEALNERSVHRRMAKINRGKMAAIEAIEARLQRK